MSTPNREDIRLETLRQVAKQLGLSAAGDADAVRQRIEDAGGRGFIQAILQQQRQELAAAQHVLRNNPTPSRLLTPELSVPAPVGENAPPAPPGATPTAAALGQAGEPQRPATPTRVDRETAIDAPAPVGAAQTPLPVPAAIGGGQTPLPVPATLPMGSAALSGGALSTGAALPGGAGTFSTAPEAALPMPGGSTASVAALGAAPDVQPAAPAVPAVPAVPQGPTLTTPAAAGTPRQPSLTTPGQAQTPNRSQPLSVPQPLVGLLSGLAGHFGSQLGGAPILPGGLSADRLLGFAGLPSFGGMASDAVRELLGGKAAGKGSSASERTGAAPDSQDVLTEAILKLTESVDALNETMRKEKAPGGLDQKTGAFKPTLGKSGPGQAQAADAPSGGPNKDGTGSDMMRLLWDSMKMALAAL